jgi:hypothetical protein
MQKAGWFDLGISFQNNQFILSLLFLTTKPSCSVPDCTRTLFQLTAPEVQPIQLRVL